MSLDEPVAFPLIFSHKSHVYLSTPLFLCTNKSKGLYAFHGFHSFFFIITLFCFCALYFFWMTGSGWRPINASLSFLPPNLFSDFSHIHVFSDFWGTSFTTSSPFLDLFTYLLSCIYTLLCIFQIGTAQMCPLIIQLSSSFGNSDPSLGCCNAPIGLLLPQPRVRHCTWCLPPIFHIKLGSTLANMILIREFIL